MRIRMSRSPDGILAIKNADEVFRTMLDAAETVDRCMAHPNAKKQIVRIGDSQQSNHRY